MSRWTQQQVVELAPDPKAVVAARKLAKPGPWSDTGSTEVLVWGKCQGSGSTPYQVSVDLTGPAFKCTCPSRKFPCKHGLALLLLWVEGDGSVADVGEAAGFAQEWQDGRSARAAGQPRRAATDEPADPAAQAKRLEQRLARMDAGAAEFEQWLTDLVREGLAAARARSYDFWDRAAGRLVDAQLPGLADRVRMMGSDIHRRDDWTDHLLTELGRWFCAARAWHRRGELTDDERGDLRVFVGWAFSSDEVKAGGTTAGTWQILGVHRTDDGRLQSQRSWLRDTASGELLQVLDFAAVGGALRVPQVTGSLVEAELARYPGGGPVRGTFAGEPVAIGRSAALAEPQTLAHALRAQADVLAANPWADRTASVVHGRFTVDQSPGFEDALGHRLPLAGDVDIWPLLARTGGHPAPAFIELESGRVRPLTIVADGDLVAV